MEHKIEIHLDREMITGIEFRRIDNRLAKYYIYHADGSFCEYILSFEKEGRLAFNLASVNNIRVNSDAFGKDATLAEYANKATQTLMPILADAQEKIIDIPLSEAYFMELAQIIYEDATRSIHK